MVDGEDELNVSVVHMLPRHLLSSRSLNDLSVITSQMAHDDNVTLSAM